MASNSDKPTIMDRMSKATLRMGVQMILEVIPIRTLMARAFDQIGEMMHAMAESLHSHPLAEDESHSVYVLEFVKMPDGTFKTLSHRAAVLKSETESGQLLVRMNEMTSIDRKIKEAMALNIPEKDMINSLVDTFSGTTKLLPTPEPLQIVHTTDALGENSSQND